MYKRLLRAAAFGLCLNVLAQAQSPSTATEINASLFRALGGSHSDSQIRKIAEERRQTLGELMASDPQAVLSAALPNEIRDAAPASVRHLIEERVKLHGAIKIVIEDGPDYSRTYYALATGDKPIALHFAGPSPTTVRRDDPVEVEGVQIGDQMALNSSAMTPAVAASSAQPIVPNTFGAQKTLVILVNFPGYDYQPVTPQGAYNLTFNDLSTFFNRSS